MSFSIMGTGSCVPEKTVTNNDLTALVDTSDEWIRRRTGIAERHVITTESVTDLGTNAARAALEDSGVAAEDIDLVLCATIRGDTYTPSEACAIAERLGIESATCFDVNAACSGMLYCFEVADCYIAAGKAENVLVISVEVLSRSVDWTDRTTCVLFGDGASACVLSRGEGLRAVHTDGYPNTTLINASTYGGKSPFATVESEWTAIRMQGAEVYKFAVGAMMKEIDAVLAETGLTGGDIDYFLPHQANIRIIEGAAKRLELPPEKVLTNVDRYGNMSAASIGVLLDEKNRAGLIKKGDVLLLVAFGAGMTAAAAVIEWVK